MMFPKLSLLLGLAVSTNACKSGKRYDPEELCDNDWRKGKGDCWKIADQMANKLQTDSGGWPKCIYPVDPDNNPTKDLDFRGCLDNGATVWEIRFLALAYHETGESDFEDAAKDGIDFVLGARHSKGGWPQYYPLDQGRSYQDAITFNDRLHLNVMALVQDMVDRNEPFDKGPFKDYRRSHAKKALKKGLEVILKTQIEDSQRAGGSCPKKIGWCAQHDMNSRKPVAARNYEKASYSGKEGMDLAEYLMELDLDKYDEDLAQDIIDAVLGAWVFAKRYVIEGCRVQKDEVDGETYKEMKKCKDSDECPDLWPRFADLKERKPVFCERTCVEDSTYEWNDVPQGFNNICDERRNGYSWTNESGKDFFKKYNAWKKEFKEYDIEDPSESCINRGSGDYLTCKSKGKGVKDICAPSSED